MSTHTAFELKRAGLIEGATITPEVIAAVAKVMISRDEQAQKFAEMAMERQETLDAVQKDALERAGLDMQLAEEVPATDGMGIVERVQWLKLRADVLGWIEVPRTESRPIAPTQEQRELLAKAFADGDMIGGVRICTTAHHQINERIDELNAIRAEMDKPGYPQAE